MHAKHLIRWLVAGALALAPLPAVAQVFLPSSYGAQCDGVTDDTAAFQTMAAAIVAAHGGTVEMPTAGNCIIYNSGQSIANPLFQLNASPFAITYFRFHGNGATFTVGHTFAPAETLVIFNVVQQGNVWIDGISVTQTTPVSTAAPAPVGTIILNTIDNSPGNTNNPYSISLINSTIIGGQAAYAGNNTRDVYLNNIQCLNCYYGLEAVQGVTGLTAVNMYSTGAARDIIMHGVRHVNIQMTALNARDNAILLFADANNEIMDDINITYHVLARTAAASAPSSYITIGDSEACACTGAVYRNLTFALDIDVSGDNATVPVVTFIKSTTSPLGISFENIRFTGKVTGALNSAGKLFDIFTSADQSWGGETASNITFENILVTGSSTPTFYIDYAPVVATTAGGVSLVNVTFPGNYTDANSSNVNTQRMCVGAAFGNLNCPLMPSFGGTGQYQPPAHSIPIAEGANPYALLTAATAGNIIIDQGAGLDWASKAVSGNCTLAASGTFTCPSAGLTIGTSTTTGGTNTRILYNNNGIVGERTQSSTAGILSAFTSSGVNGNIVKQTDTAGSTGDAGFSVTLGSANQLAYWSSLTVLSPLATANNGVLVTSGAGVPSISTMLPSGLTASSFTVTGSFTATGLVTNADLVDSSITLNAGTNVGLTAPGAMSLGSTYTIGTTSDTVRLGSLGLGVAAPAAGYINISGRYQADSNDVMYQSGHYLQITNGPGGALIQIGDSTDPELYMSSTVSSHSIYPSADNSFPFGLSNARWSQVVAVQYYAGGSSGSPIQGLTCSGTPTSSFASTNGIVTHC
jgi:hypothetical protein